MRNGVLLRPLNLLRPRPQAGAKPIRPFIDRFKNDGSALATHNHLAFIVREPTFLWETHGLTAAVLKQLGTLHE